MKVYTVPVCSFSDDDAIMLFKSLEVRGRRTTIKGVALSESQGEVRVGPLSDAAKKVFPLFIHLPHPLCLPNPSSHLVLFTLHPPLLQYPKDHFKAPSLSLKAAIHRPPLP